MLAISPRSFAYSDPVDYMMCYDVLHAVHQTNTSKMASYTSKYYASLLTHTATPYHTARTTSLYPFKCNYLLFLFVSFSSSESTAGASASDESPLSDGVNERDGDGVAERDGDGVLLRSCRPLLRPLSLLVMGMAPTSATAKASGSADLEAVALIGNNVCGRDGDLLSELFLLIS